MVSWLDELLGTRDLLVWDLSDATIHVGLMHGIPIIIVTTAMRDSLRGRVSHVEIVRES